MKRPINPLMQKCLRIIAGIVFIAGIEPFAGVTLLPKQDLSGDYWALEIIFAMAAFFAGLAIFLHWLGNAPNLSPDAHARTTRRFATVVAYTYGLFLLLVSTGIAYDMRWHYETSLRK